MREPIGEFSPRSCLTGRGRRRSLPAPLLNLAVLILVVMLAITTTLRADTAAITIDAAWQTHTDDQLGSLEVGKFADLVFLSDDPQRVNPDAIADIIVTQTRLAGAPVTAT